MDLSRTGGCVGGGGEGVVSVFYSYYYSITIIIPVRSLIA